MKALRSEVAVRHAAGESGVEICNWFSDQLDGLLQEMIRTSLAGKRCAGDR